MKRTLSSAKVANQESAARVPKKQRVNISQKVQGPQLKRKREEAHTPPRTPTKRTDALTASQAEIFQRGPHTPESQIRSQNKIWNSIHSKQNSVLQTPIKSPSFSNDRIRMTSRRALKFGDDQLEKTPCSKDFSLLQTLNVNSAKKSSIGSKNAGNFEQSSENQNFQQGNNVEHNFLYGKQQMEIIEEGEEEEILKGETRDESLKEIKMLGKCVKNQISKSLEILQQPFQQYCEQLLPVNNQQRFENKQLVQSSNFSDINQGDDFKNVHVPKVVQNKIVNHRRHSMGELLNTPSSSKVSNFQGLQQQCINDVTARTIRRHTLQNNSRKSMDIIQYQQNSMQNIPQQILEKTSIDNNQQNQQQQSRNFFPQGGPENQALALNSANQNCNKYASKYIQFSHQNNNIFSHGFDKSNYVKYNNNNQTASTNQSLGLNFDRKNIDNNYTNKQIQGFQSQNQEQNLDRMSNFGKKNYGASSRLGNQNLSQQVSQNFGNYNLNQGAQQSSNFGIPQKNSGMVEGMNEERLEVDAHSSGEKKNFREDLFTPDRLKIAPMDSAKDVAKFIRSRRIMFDSYAFNDVSDVENNK